VHISLLLSEPFVAGITDGWNSKDPGQILDYSVLLQLILVAGIGHAIRDFAANSFKQLFREFSHVCLVGGALAHCVFFDEVLPTERVWKKILQQDIRENAAIFIFARLAFIRLCKWDSSYIDLAKKNSPSGRNLDRGTRGAHILVSCTMMVAQTINGVDSFIADQITARGLCVDTCIHRHP
jgi:hypothetical protein